MKNGRPALRDPGYNPALKVAVTVDERCRLLERRDLVVR